MGNKQRSSGCWLFTLAALGRTADVSDNNEMVTEEPGDGIYESDEWTPHEYDAGKDSPDKLVVPPKGSTQELMTPAMVPFQISARWVYKKCWANSGHLCQGACAGMWQGSQWCWIHWSLGMWGFCSWPECEMPQQYVSMNGLPAVG